MTNRDPAQGGNINTLLKSADQARKSGDIAAALAGYSAILGKMPAHSKAKKAVLRIRKDLGGAASLTQADIDQLVKLLQSGDFAATATQARILLVLAPSEALIHNVLGMSLSQLGQHTGAISAFRTAVKLRGKYPEAQANLGGEFLSVGKLNEAQSALEKALAQKSDLPEGWHNLAMTLVAKGDYDGALAGFERALTLRPNYANALNGKGAALSDLMRYDEAKACFQKVLDKNPADLAAMINLGYAHSTTGMDDQAIEILSKVVAKDPDNGQVWYRLGVIKGQLGQKDAAFDCFDKALAADPTHFEVYRTKSTLKKFTADDPDLAQLDRLLADNTIDENGRMHLAFARGKAREDLADYHGAFVDWKLGNDIRYRGFNHTPAQDTALFEQIKSTFNAAYFAAPKQGQDPNTKPIFVLGMNRSGTTLVEQILASHTDVFGAGELVDMDFFGRDNLDEIATNADFNFADFAKTYGDQLSRLSGGAARVIDKLPINFLWVGLIKSVYPNATIVHLSRDPRDNCLSIYKNYFDSQGNQYAYDLNALAGFYLNYKSLMAHWDDVLPGAVYTLSYEALTADLEGECRKLLAHCGLAWQDQVLSFHKSSRSVKTASIQQVRQKVYTSSVQSWKRFEAELAPLIKHLHDGGIVLPE